MLQVGKQALGHELKFTDSPDDISQIEFKKKIAEQGKVINQLKEKLVALEAKNAELTTQQSAHVKEMVTQFKNGFAVREKQVVALKKEVEALRKERAARKKP